MLSFSDWLYSFSNENIEATPSAFHLQSIWPIDNKHMYDVCWYWFHNDHYKDISVYSKRKRWSRYWALLLLTNLRWAFRRKNTLHASHALAPYTKPLDGTPQTVHGNDDDDWSSMYSIMNDQIDRKKEWFFDRTNDESQKKWRKNVQERDYFVLLIFSRNCFFCFCWTSVFKRRLSISFLITQNKSYLIGLSCQIDMTEYRKEADKGNKCFFSLSLFLSVFEKNTSITPRRNTYMIATRMEWEVLCSWFFTTCSWPHL